MRSFFRTKAKQPVNEQGAAEKADSSVHDSEISDLLRNAAASGDSAFEVAATTSVERVDVGETAVPGGGSPQTHAPGDARHYTIGHAVAQGGMGTILHARDLNLRRTVAMKVILPDKHDHEQYHLRFLQEAQLTAQLEHPNIVPVHELGADEQGKPFYTMKFVQGITLHEVLEKIKAGDSETITIFPLAHLLTIFQKVCDAVAFAHSRGVVHRDLKPENVMLGDYGEVLVMDWGLAKRIEDRGSRIEDSHPPSSILHSPSSDLTLSGQILGTPHFMAPEQAAGKLDEIDARTDIFALGGILYNILTLRPPVHGGSLAELIGKIRSGDIAPPTSHNPKSGIHWKKAGPDAEPRLALVHCPDKRIPQALSSVTMKAVAVRREDRYQSVGELQKDIEAYQGGFATSAEQARPLKLIWLLIKRRKIESAAIAVILVLVVGFMTKIVASERKATTALAQLRGSAPEYHDKALALIEERKFDEALEKISYALTLIPNEPSYHALNGNILQALLRPKEARDAYAEALRLDKTFPHAEANKRLCEKILKENAGRTEMLPVSLVELQRAMQDQKRFREASWIAEKLKDTQAITDAWKGVLQKMGVLERLSVGADGSLNLDLSNQPVNSLERLEGLPLTSLNLIGTQVSDLRPLHRMPLRRLSLGGQPLTDLEPLKGLALNEIFLSDFRQVADLSPLSGMPLRELWLTRVGVADLSALKAMPLTTLGLTDLPVTDLSPLRSLPLKTLSIAGLPVSDFRFLNGMPLEALKIVSAQFIDPSILQGMPLKGLNIEGVALRDLSFLSGMQLETLDIDATQINDLTPLRGLPLTSLRANGTKATDFSVLRGMPLQELRLRDSQIEDLSVLRGMPLNYLDLSGTPIRDLSPLRGMSLISLNLVRCAHLRDLTPLADCTNLRGLVIPDQCKDIEFLRALPNLARLGYREADTPAAAEFWKNYDAQKEEGQR